MNPATSSVFRPLILLLALITLICPKAWGQSETPPGPPENSTFAELQEGAESLARELASAREIAAGLDADSRAREARIAAIPAELAAARVELASQNTSASDDEGAVAARVELAEQIAALEKQASDYQSDATKIVERRRAANERLAALTTAQAQWQSAADAARTREAAKDRTEASTRVDDFVDNMTLADLAKANVALAARRTAVSQQVADAHLYQVDIAAKNKQFHAERLSAEGRVELLERAGLPIDKETGELLRAQRAQIPSARQMRAQLRQRVRESAEAGLKRLAVESERKNENLQDLDARVGEIIAAAPKGAKPDPAAVRSLLEERRAIYEALTSDHQKRVSALNTTNELATRTVDDAIAHARFLDERLLWIPSAAPLAREDFAKAGAALRTLGSELAGGSWLTTLLADFKSSPLPWLVWAVAMVLLIARRGELHRGLVESGTQAARRNCQSFLPTAIALGSTILLALPLPLALGFLAWRCEHPSAPGGVLIAAAAFTALVGSARLVSRPGGLLVSHFRFEPTRAALIHRNLNWFLPIGGITITTAAALPQVAPPPAGRLFFILAMVLLMVLHHRLLRPSKGLVRRRGRPTRFAYAWYWAGIAIPGALGIGAALGYFESVQALRLRAVGSLWFLLIVLFIVALLLRWILVSRRRLAVAQALRHRELALAAHRQDDGDVPSLKEAKAAAIDVAGVEEQTARLVHFSAMFAILFGLSAIWAGTLPALSVLEKVPIWPAEQVAAAPAPAEAAPTDGVVSPLTATPIQDSATTGEGLGQLIKPQTDGVSLRDLLLAIILLVITFVAARNIPGLLELTVLRRLDLRPGGSFAFTTTVRYLIVVVGIVIAFGQVGITWSKVQWIAAAITLGVGFGLQEVFANFVAGLILLFERPFRIGDTVTVGDVSGKVSQIRMRATTIRQFNNRELVVPNKDFITGQLVNWTLSDAVLRFELPVGIAYGSDTQKARELMLEVAASHPKILASPEPQVVFTAFGDSALSFELRAHVGTVEELIQTKTDMHYAIDDAFRSADIEIAFPQTDIHIRSMPEPDKNHENSV